MPRKIGEIVYLDCGKIEVVEPIDKSCRGCYFDGGKLRGCQATRSQLQVLLMCMDFWWLENPRKVIFKRVGGLQNECET